MSCMYKDQIWFICNLMLQLKCVTSYIGEMCWFNMMNSKHVHLKMVISYNPIQEGLGY